MSMLRLFAFRVLPNRIRLAAWRAVIAWKKVASRPPLLTVIVPVYNVENYLEESLVSLRNQTLLDIQIIAINDGSTDGSGDLLDRLAKQDPRIEVIHQTNAGLGAARNVGLTRSRGRFVTFMDPDDIIPSTAYALMVDTLRKTGSRFVVGRIVRLKSGKYIMPGFAKQVHEFDRFGTTIEEFPDAFMDIIACNRMFVREFWMGEIGLFPEGVAYEDHVPVTAAYLRADKFDVLHTTTYDWRIREDETSIGQQKHQLQNLKDRLTAKYEAWELIQQHPNERVRMAWVGRVLGMDLPAFVLPAVEADDSYRVELRGAIQFFVDLVTADNAWDMGSTHNKVLLWFALQNRWQDLEGAVQEVRQLGYRVPTAVEAGRVVANKDILGPLLREVPQEYLWPSKFELSPNATFDALRWEENGSLVLEGWTNLAMVDMVDHPQSLAISLVSKDGSIRIPASGSRAASSRANYYSGHRFSDYWNASFRARWDPGALHTALSGGKQFSVLCESSVSGVSSQSQIKLSAPDSSREQRIWAAPRKRAYAWISNESGVTVAGRAPKSDEYISDELRFGRLRRLISAHGVRVSGYSVSEDALCLTVKSPLGMGPLRSATFGPPSQQVDLSPDEISRVAGGWTLSFSLRHDPWNLGESRIPNGRYVLRLGNGSHARIDSRLLKQLPMRTLDSGVEFFPTTGKFLEFSLHLNDFDIRHTSTVLERERSMQLHRDASLPLKESVLFQCYLGEQVGDSPLELCRELQRRGTNLKLYWGVSNYSVAVPEGTHAVRVNSPEWFEVLSTAKYLCNNVDFPEWFTRRDGQEFIQTFHGQPFKQMGLQHWEQNGASESKILFETQRRQNAWTRMLLPHEEAVDWYEAAYPGAGDLTVLGLPRNDTLVGPSPHIASNVRSVLGVGSEQRLVMYAPTWRESKATSGWTAAGVDFIELSDLAAQLGDAYTVMYRGHNFNVRAGEARRRGASIVDASAYPDINHLIQAADVAVLDYSSLRFDFAITGKPMVFFVPDEQEYFELRPGLLPFRETAPGPLVHDPAKLADAIRDVMADGPVAERSRTQIEAFNARFNRLQDGNAAARVLDHVFTS